MTLADSNKSILRLGISTSVFLLLIFVSFHLIPYVLTIEKYSYSNADINSVNSSHNNTVDNKGIKTESKQLSKAATDSHISNDKVNSLLPVIVVENEQPMVINWNEYAKSNHNYQPYQANSTQKIQLSDYEFVIVKPTAVNTYKVKLSLDNYSRYASYQLKEGRVIPLSYHFSGMLFIPIVLTVVIVLYKFIFKKLLNLFYSRLGLLREAN